MSASACAFVVTVIDYIVAHSGRCVVQCHPTRVALCHAHRSAARRTNGQICSSTSRLLIDKRVAQRFVARLVEETRKICIGDPTAEGTKLGPLVSRAQQQKVLGFVERAVEAGARLLCGGGSPASQRSGWFVEPTVLEVEPSMEIWQEEVFGPVLCVRVFDTDDEAVALANDSQYGLAGAVITNDQTRATQICESLRVGCAWINCIQPMFPNTVWGGPGRSSIGRELGEYSLNNFLEPKVSTKQVPPLNRLLPHP